MVQPTCDGEKHEAHTSKIVDESGRPDHVQPSPLRIYRRQRPSGEKRTDQHADGTERTPDASK